MGSICVPISVSRPQVAEFKWYFFFSRTVCPMCNDVLTILLPFSDYIKKNSVKNPNFWKEIENLIDGLKRKSANTATFRIFFQISIFLTVCFFFIVKRQLNFRHFAEKIIEIGPTALEYRTSKKNLSSESLCLTSRGQKWAPVFVFMSYFRSVIEIKSLILVKRLLEMKSWETFILYNAWT